MPMDDSEEFKKKSPPIKSFLPKNAKNIIFSSAVSTLLPPRLNHKGARHLLSIWDIEPQPSSSL